MSPSTDDLRQLLRRDEYSRSSGYDPRWILDNQMGLNPLWLIEWICITGPHPRDRQPRAQASLLNDLVVLLEDTRRFSTHFMLLAEKR